MCANGRASELFFVAYTSRHREWLRLGREAGMSGHSEKHIGSTGVEAAAVKPHLTAGPSFQQQNERLQLLLKLTSSITSNLALKEVLHAVASNVREVMHCDEANVSLPGSDPGTFRIYALDFPGSKGFAKEEQIVVLSDDSPAKRGFETLKPVISNTTVGSHDTYGHKIAATEGLKTVCFIPLVNRGRA